ncbi:MULTISPECIES: SDR family NAD(P)-dependent oxidoreductase [unclassified Rhizobium]|jgi:NAD(P)-dependent dehydrogenase (short-subunit alcohol dehydrogenase family)|uniref:SDR family NAD(P)-dependent oxidoreductase n=1 Tax=unclassified Rhizobium TaxID=2613769 RepID=UPI003818F80F
MGSFATRGEHAPLAVRQVVPTRSHARKRYLVLGGAGGAGKAAAELLAAEGASVVIGDVREQALNEAIAGLGPHSKTVSGVVVDLSSAESIAAAIEQAEHRLGALDGLVNCAAIVRHVDPLETPWTDWERIFSINVFGAFEAARLVAKAMIAKGIKGAIVNVASEAGKKGHTQSLAYSASKAAMINFTRVLSEVLAPNDINVNCVCPGGMATDMLREVAVAYGGLVDQAPDDVFKQLVSSQLRRHIDPAELARTISFLLSDDAMIIRGQAINTDGGDTPY